MEHKIKVGITQGDINRVGYEVILKTLSDPHIVELCTPVVYGSAKVAAYHRKALDIPAVNFNIISDASAADENKVNLITCVDDDVKAEIGKVFAKVLEHAGVYKRNENGMNAFLHFAQYVNEIK